MGGDSFRVLLIDDNADDTILTRRVFSKVAPEVQMHVAHSGTEAINYLKGTDPFGDRALYPLPSLLLLDLKMPGLDGFDVIHWVRTESELRQVPILVLSSSNQPADISRAHELGANAYHVKPSDLNAFYGLVEGLKAYWLDKSLGPV